MGPIDYLKGVKRRWRSVAGITALALVAAALSVLVYSTGTGRHPFSATASLIQNSVATNQAGSGTSRTQTSNRPEAVSSLTTIAALVETDQMLSRVAKVIHYDGTPAQLAGKVTTIAEQTQGFLRITARASDPENAKKLADAFATELINFLRERQIADNDAEAKGIQTQMARVRHDIAGLDRQLARYPGVQTQQGGSSSARRTSTTPSAADPILAERDAALRELGTLSQNYQSIKSRVANAEGLEIFQRAQLTSASSGRIPIPRSLASRMLIALILGLLGGAGLSVLRDRFDRRIRTRESAEDHFGYPVLAEIPNLKKRGRNDSPLRPAEMAPRVADAFRLLGAGINGNGDGSRNGESRRSSPSRGPGVILVTSAGPAEGKTSVVASLATTFAEVGKTVLVLSADFRHPEVHREFGISNEHGLAEALRDSNGGPVLNGCLSYTSVKGVSLVPSGRPVETPDQLLASAAMRRAVMEARGRSEVVLIDTSPILTSDVAFLLSHVDSVLLVARAGQTRPDLAERSSELLKRLNAPVAGVVLIGDAATALPRGYYRKRSLLRTVVGMPVAVLGAVWRGLRWVARRGKAEKAVEPAVAVAPVKVPAPIYVPASEPREEDRGFPPLSRPSSSE